MAMNNRSTDGTLHEENMHCFVCDTMVTGLYFPLATVRAQSSGVRLIEKLGALVGDQYMVVISEDDVICRCCSTYMNSLDHLETEALSVRSIVLKFLEKKYSLTEGELVNQTNTGLSQPPRIIHSDTPDGDLHLGEPPYGENFMAKKRKAAIAAMNNAKTADPDSTVQYKNSPTDQWMQCGTCKYTTSVDSFMRNHMLESRETKYVKKRKFVAVTKAHQGKKRGNIAEKRAATATAAAEEECTKMNQNASASEPSPGSSGCDSIELADGNSMTNNENPEPMEAETINIQIVRPGQSRKTYYGSKKKEMTIVLPEIPEEAMNLDIGEVITGDPEHIGLNDALMKITQEVEEDAVYVHMDENSIGQRKTTKQVLTVGEDGSVEVVEVLWDEITNTAVGQGSLEY